MKPAPTIQEIGGSLYGSLWQSELARALNMSGRHMRRLAAGTADLNQGMLEDIKRVALERRATLDRLIKRL